jgi:3-oxoacyl-[acyl-carrier-protein] synthase II
MLGHLLGGASGVEGIITVMSVYKQRIHPNLNLDDPEDELDLGYFMGPEAIDTQIEVAMSNSFGFGGHNSSVVFKRWRE